MIMTKTYFESNCIYGVEFEDEEGFRFWESGTMSEVTKMTNDKLKKGYYLSDIDLATTQPDEAVRHFLNVVEYNWFHNKEMLERLQIGSLGKLIERALDRWDYE